MKRKMLELYRKYHELYLEFNEKDFVKAVKSSFAYNLLKASLFIILLIMLIFQVRPKSAYIFAELDNINYSYFTAETIIASDITDDFEVFNDIFSNNKIRMSLEGLSINGVDYYSGDYLEICPNYNETASIRFLGDKEYLLFFNGFADSIMNSETTIWCFDGEQRLIFRGKEAYIVAQEESKLTKLDISQELVISCSSREDSFDFYKSNLELAGEENVDVSQNESRQYLQDVDNNLNDSIYMVMIYSEPLKTRHRSYISNMENIDADVEACKFVANGRLTISYTPTSEEYTLQKQEIWLHSDNSSLNLHYNANNGTAILSGYVDDATLSKMDLFPNFWMWYFSNLYMAPLTLVSAVISAISMMYNSNKK